MPTLRLLQLTTRENAYSTGAINCIRSCDENVAGTLSMQIIALRGDSPFAFTTWLKQVQTERTKLCHKPANTI